MVRPYYGDLWAQSQTADAVVITTNGSVKKDGKAVMGRGCAKQAAHIYPELAALLGVRIKARGNQPYVFLFGKKKQPDLHRPAGKHIRRRKPGESCRRYGG